MMMQEEYEYPPDVSLIRRIVAGHFAALADILNSSPGNSDQIHAGAVAEIAQGVDLMTSMLRTDFRLSPTWTYDYISLPDSDIWNGIK